MPPQSLGARILALLTVLGRLSVCDDEPGGASYTVFVFPPPGFCFPDPRSVYLTSSVSDALFGVGGSSAVRVRGLEVEFRINGQVAAIVPWTPGGGFDADEGLSHRLAVPGLSDGEYSASIVLRLGAGDVGGRIGDSVGETAETHFLVDSAGGCRRFAEEEEGLGKGGGSCTVADGGHHVGGSGDDGEGEHPRVLVNSAAGAPSWQSSTSDGHPASLANDGEAMVSSKVNGFSQTGAQEGLQEWWEVDLGRDAEISLVDVLGGRRANGVGMYPPVVPGPYDIGEFDVQILSSAWHLVSQRRFHPSPGSVFSWPNVSTHGRYVRIRLVTSGVVLELREVSVWTWHEWNCPSQCLHGVCGAGGQCECGADFLGTQCGQNILTDDTFLPPPTWHAPLQMGFDREGRQLDDFDAALKAVEALQTPASCSPADALVMGFHTGGLAATISLVTGLHAIAFSLGKALLLWRQSEWFYADASECPSRQLDCYFEAWHTCSALDIDTFAQGAFHLQAEETPEARGVQVFAHVPKDFEHRGTFWWRSVLSDFIFRPLPWFQEDIDAGGLARQMKLGQDGKGYIGLHYRAGDSCVKWQRDFGGDCIGLDHHLALVRLIAYRYQLRDVFVATDDPTAIDRLRQSEEEEGGELRFVGVERFRGLLREMEETKHTWTEDRLRTGQVPSGPLLRSTVADIILLSRASAFVLHFASNLSRLAYQLAYAKTRQHLPFVSVDGPWCYHWQLCCDVDREGRSHMCS